MPWKPGEWTIKEILIHILDTERIYCYRALRFARNDATSLAGFDQDAYVPYYPEDLQIPRNRENALKGRIIGRFG